MSAEPGATSALAAENALLARRIYEFSYRNHLSHLGSCLSAVPIINEIFHAKQEDEKFILSSGHAGVALYLILQHRYGLDAQAMLDAHGIHPSKDLPNQLHCSSGSLGCGLPIAVGHALADRSKNVYVLISDGESAEGSVWEALAFARNYKLTNLHVYVNINGMSAYDHVDVPYLCERLQAFLPTINIRLTGHTSVPFAAGLKAHYYVLKEEDFEALKVQWAQADQAER